MQDPYQLSGEAVQEPPVTFFSRLKHLGPGFILSATIVGSGELIATTTLGARAGFITFWVIIASCLIKVAVQLEFAKHTILTGETSMVVMNKLPGPAWGKAKWAVWSMLVMMALKFLQVGGIVGGVAIIMNIGFPGVSVGVWSFVIAILVALLIFRGYYQFVEKGSLILIAVFTIFTFSSLYFLKYTPFDFTWQDVWTGLQFRLPKEAVAVAIAAFGITGVSGEEIIYYNYWCLEKGYARYTGPRENTAAWKSRARGWINTMYMDAISAMVLYTVVTGVFYLLGAAVLHARGTIPQGYEMVETLSAMYTESLGPWAKTVFLVGAFMVLFSTLFASLASWTRLFTDIFGRIGWINFDDMHQRVRWVMILAWVIPVVWALSFVFIRLPVIMVLSGGIVGALILFLVVFAVIHIRYYRADSDFISGKIYDLTLWVSIIAIASVGIYGVFRLF